MTEPMTREKTANATGVESCNEVTLVGRVSAAPETRDLPSGDQLVTLRLVVDRPPPTPAQRKAQKSAQKKGEKKVEKGAPKRAVDVIDVACWTRRVQRTAASIGADDVIRVEGALRRRFFAAGGGTVSRYEVEAARLVRVSRA
jgi:single-strand DNA-binding protein